jgi:hypothetical protein
MKAIIRMQAMLIVASALFLAGCSRLPDFGLMGPEFKPLTYEVAKIAAPEDPAATAPRLLLYCRIGTGAARFGDVWQDIRETDFTLQAGGIRSDVRLGSDKGSGMSLQGLFDHDGQKVVFCPVVEGSPDEVVTCTSLYALDDDLDTGIRRTFDVPDAVRGSAISCAFDGSKLQKLERTEERGD